MKSRRECVEYYGCPKFENGLRRESSEEIRKVRREKGEAILFIGAQVGDREHSSV